MLKIALIVVGIVLVAGVICLFRLRSLAKRAVPLHFHLRRGCSLEQAATRSGMDLKTAQKLKAKLKPNTLLYHAVSDYVQANFETLKAKYEGAKAS